jgi:GT2 family glycosyltransferase
MKLGLVIASHGRADILRRTLDNLLSQSRIPDDVIISAVDPEDVPKACQGVPGIQSIFGGAGLTRQRNRGMSPLLDKADVIVFLDDDFIVGNDYFLNMERIFAQDDEIIGVNGEVVADGANSPGLTADEGLRLGEQYARQKTAPYIREIEGAYGCNMAFRAASIGSQRFDERLPLYGWQEDLDFCGALRGRGRIVRTNLVWGIHLGTKRGKGSEVRLGYSQIINPAYIVRKGNMSFAYAFRLASKNLLANLARSIRPESYIDRRGRLRGNLIGMFHLATGRLTPEYVLKLE